MTDAQTYPYEEAGYTILGPECFTMDEGRVISLKGENFYKACNFKVADLHDGGASHCVKRVDHPGKKHEDYDGRIYDEVHGFDPDTLEIPTPTLWPSDAKVTRTMIREAWNLYILPTQEAGEAQSEEMRTVMACLRLINEALPMDEETIEAAPSVVSIEIDGDMIPAVVKDEVDGPCSECGNNEWTSSVMDAEKILICTTCASVRLDR